jgi:activator of 2-hydroxyglutaryl-CoA dehydratase
LNKRSFLIEALKRFTHERDKNENINDGLAQCIAEMYAAQIVNQKNLEENIKTVYGTVTTGQVWRFISLDKNKTCRD